MLFAARGVWSETEPYFTSGTRYANCCYVCRQLGAAVCGQEKTPRYGYGWGTVRHLGVKQLITKLLWQTGVVLSVCHVIAPERSFWCGLVSATCPLLLLSGSSGCRSTVFCAVPNLEPLVADLDDVIR